MGCHIRIVPRRSRLSVAELPHPSIGSSESACIVMVRVAPALPCSSSDFVIQSNPMDVEQAVADLAEVRLRLVTLQRFDGVSGQAAIASGMVALIAGSLQYLLIPLPLSAADVSRYLAIWLGCLGLALVINYGAILSWLAHERRLGARGQVRNVGKTILPAIVIGGVLTASLLGHRMASMLPGAWSMCYALGLFASKAMLPRSVVSVASGFTLFGAVLLLVPASAHTLVWWVMPLLFGTGQIAIGVCIFRG